MHLNLFETTQAASWPIDDLAQGMEVLTPAAKSFVTAALRFCNVQRRHATLQEARFREAQRQEAPHHQTEAGGTTFQSVRTLPSPVDTVS
jgi:hypothetical protein